MAVYDSINWGALGAPAIGSGSTERSLGTKLMSAALDNLKDTANAHEERIKEMNTETIMNMIREGKKPTNEQMKAIGVHDPKLLEQQRLNYEKFGHMMKNDDRRFGLDQLKTQAQLKNYDDMMKYRYDALDAQTKAAGSKPDWLTQQAMKNQMDINTEIQKKELGLGTYSNKGKGGKNSLTAEKLLKDFGIYTDYSDETNAPVDNENMAKYNAAVTAQIARGVPREVLQAAAAGAVKNGYLGGIFGLDEMLFDVNKFNKLVEANWKKNKK